MKRTALIPLTLSLLALAACANDKPVTDASGQTSTTSARYPDGTMSSNTNDTSATGAATNESPSYPSHSNGSASSSGATAPMPANGSNSASTGSRTDTAVPTHDTNRSADASSTNGNFNNAGGAPGSQPGTTAPPPPQNNSPSVTPVDQGNGSTDLKITQAIRKEVVANGDLSFTAKNVKIITKGGHVTLKGEVKTQKERDAIEGTAVRVAGASNVDDQVVVKP